MIDIKHIEAAYERIKDYVGEDVKVEIDQTNEES